MATKKEIIRDFAENRPAAEGVYGYGSGVFKQPGNTNKKPLTDVIFIVKDIKNWHRLNMDLNEDDYSFLGRIHLNKASISKIKGRNKVTYLSEISENGYLFKYGVIELDDFKRGLENWDNIFMAGRFHKPVMEIKSTIEIREAIRKNHKTALFIAALYSNEFTTVHDIFIKLCSLSYLGDVRMKIAENPHKVEDIVEGSLKQLKMTYDFEVDYLVSYDDNKVFVNYGQLLTHIDELPSALKAHLIRKNVDLNDIDSIREAIQKFISLKNRVESRYQILDGIRTNGIVRSVPYALHKVQRRFTK